MTFASGIVVDACDVAAPPPPPPSPPLSPPPPPPRRRRARSPRRRRPRPRPRSRRADRGAWASRPARSAAAAAVGGASASSRSIVGTRTRSPAPPRSSAPPRARARWTPRPGSPDASAAADRARRSSPRTPRDPPGRRARGDEALSLGQRRACGRGQRGAAEVARGLVALVRLLLQRTGEDGLERLRQVGVAFQHRRRRAAVVRVELGEVVVEVERDAAGQRREQDAAQRVDVGARVTRSPRACSGAT